jgi:hypothetical protein
VTFGLGSSIAEFFKDTKKIYSEKKRYDELHKASEQESMEVWQQIKKIKRTFEKEYNENISAREKPLILYIDTFELYNLDTKWLFTGENSREYSYGLCHSLKFTMWVISGRESLKLKEEDYWGASFYKSIKLENFDEKISKYYINNVCKISDAKITEKILNEAKGDPLLLNVYTDMYLSYKVNKTRNANELFLEMFERELNREALIRLSIRYIRYLESGFDQIRAERFGDILKYLACIGSWELTDSESIKQEFFSLENNFDSIFNTINEQSLIYSKLDEEDNIIYYHAC